jgi:hypothetical protein
MGFRFRKSIRLGKILRINLSKSGIGTSVGVPGYRVGIGPRGKRTTVSLPGTGLSYVKEESLKKKPAAQVRQPAILEPAAISPPHPLPPEPIRPQSNPSYTPAARQTKTFKTLGTIAILSTAVIVLCGIGSAILAAIGGVRPEPTANIDQAISNIYSTMTMEAAIRKRHIELTSLAPTATQEPTETQVPTETFSPTIAPVLENTLAPSQTPYPTRTPVQAIVVPVQPTAVIQSSGNCNCSRDYNCSDFSTHAAAQACYIQCGGNDWSGLDRDKDGIACENLP